MCIRDREIADRFDEIKQLLMKAENNIRDIDTFFDKGHYYSLEDILEEAHTEIWLFNRIGFNILNTNYSALEAAIKRGCHIKMIIGSEDAVLLQGKWSRMGKSGEKYLEEQQQAIQMAKQLLALSSQENAISIKTIPVLYSYNATFIDPGSVNGFFTFTPYSYPSRRDYGWEFKARFSDAEKICSFLIQDFNQTWEKADSLVL